MMLLSRPKIVRMSTMPAMLLLIAFSTTVTKVKACGGFFCQSQQPVLQAGENIAFGVEQIDETTVAVQMAVQINYQGPASSFAWILPVPAVPDLSVGSELLFRGLFASTVPSFSFVIDPTQSTTCDPSLFDDFVCPEAGGDMGFDGGEPNFSPGPDAATEDAAVVVEQGTVGPFEFVTLEPADARPESVFEWLQENGYDQPEEAGPLVTYYAEMGMKFVALQLLKDSETGDIRPIVLKYQIPGNLADSPVAFIPIQLTSIAATSEMPIQVYTLATSRGVPKNYVHANLDLRYLDWLGCSGGGFAGPDSNCYLSNLRNMLEVASMEVNGHTFITEYAGSTKIAANTIALTGLNISKLEQMTDPLEFLLYISDANVPATPLVHKIIEYHIPNEIQNKSDLVPPMCYSLPNIYTPGFAAWQMSSCVEFVDFGENEFNPLALAAELQEEVFQPAQEAQDWVDSYSYLTRLYAQLDPEDMNKDPFFAFNEQLDDVSNQIAATAVPLCNDTWPIGLEISLNIPSAGLEEPVFIEAIMECATWFSAVSTDAPFGNKNPAYSFTGFNFSGLEHSIILRDPTTGQFSFSDINQLISILDDSVPAQTVPDPDATRTTTPTPELPMSEPAPPATSESTPPPMTKSPMSEESPPPSEAANAVGKYSLLAIVVHFMAGIILVVM